jgi:hypothetical protein
MQPGHSDDRFDEMRRGWIAAHQDQSIVQRRRAELLGRQGDRQCSVAAVARDRHDDTIVAPLWLPSAKSLQSEVETLIVLAVLVLIGWLCPHPYPYGRVVRLAITRIGKHTDAQAFLAETNTPAIVDVQCDWSRRRSAAAPLTLGWRVTRFRPMGDWWRWVACTPSAPRVVGRPAFVAAIPAAVGGRPAAVVDW